ncbi:sensor histidine kinase [Segnochrobactrum spirostomi]|nr:HAMP domain-containing sensor histidine kinase [Segnochrobactrum spirostomi]
MNGDGGDLRGGGSEGGKARPAAPGLPNAPPRRRARIGLSGKLLLLTLGFMLAAETLTFVPAVTCFEQRWLQNRLDNVGLAAGLLAADAPGRDAALLSATGATWARITPPGGPGWSTGARPADLAPARVGDGGVLSGNPIETLSALFATPERVEIAGRLSDGTAIETVIDGDRLREALRDYAARFASFAAVVSLITVALVYGCLRQIVVQPLRRMARSMESFAAHPERPDARIQRPRRRDEIGDAEARLAALQNELARMLTEQRRLAELGLAVSKINHDLRNLLASAQLLSDRLRTVADPAVQRIAPKIMATLDRAVFYTQTVLEYGAAREAPPERRVVSLARLLDEVMDVAGLTDHATIELVRAVPRGLEIDADPEQLFRVLLNLVRNARQALESGRETCVVRRLTISAERQGGVVRIRVGDTGPGVPDRARENLFRAFHGSVRAGGAGLGLAIADEIVRAHGGRIALVGGHPAPCSRSCCPTGRSISPPCGGAPDAE